MNGQRRLGFVQVSTLVGLLLTCASPVRAENPSTWIGANNPAARFHGAPTYDLMVTNVSWKVVNKDYTEVTFDLSWSGSWRVKWTESADKSVTGKPIEVENWDAAWVFVKFLPETNSIESIERNHWQHATLAPDPAQHVMPAGATSTLRLSEDGSRGMGVFIYRDAIGHGANDFKAVKLRWLNGAGKVDPAKAAVKVHAIAMVYVPEGPFKVGSGLPTGISKFNDGPDMPFVRYDWESSFLLPDGSWSGVDWGSLTDGSWRGGPSIRFLIDAEWNRPVQEGTRARRFGTVAGQLWATQTFAEQFHGVDGSCTAGTALSDDYPTGYDAFYCMKYDVTQGQYTDFLNSLPPDVAAGRAFCAKPETTLVKGTTRIVLTPEVGSQAERHIHEIKVDGGADYEPYTVTEFGGLTITSPMTDRPAKSMSLSDIKVGKESDLLADDEPEDAFMDAFVEEMTTSDEAKAEAKLTRPPVYAVRCPFRRSPSFSAADARAFAVWAGLRTMTQLEYTKAQWGPQEPPPASFKSGGPITNKSIQYTQAEVVMLDAGLPTERYEKGFYSVGYLAARVGIRATADSDQATAGASYWGISELSGGGEVLIQYRDYRGTHGDGNMPAGSPGASFARKSAPFTEMPADWPEPWQYAYRGQGDGVRLVANAANRIRKTPPKPVIAAKAEPVTPPASGPEDTTRADTIRITNVKREAGTKDYSMVTFDLSWDNSWRAKWTEPADKNVTGKPLEVESWDAAWVVVKFRQPGEIILSHASLDIEAADHVKPAGAALDVGISDDGLVGTGVFIYRDAIGQGTNNFKGVKLRWLHPDPFASADSSVTNPPAAFDPVTVELKVYAIGMVYVPEGPFLVKSPWDHPLSLVNNADPTAPGGHPDWGTSSIPKGETWPNAYNPYYIMKYSISQGEYAGWLNEPGAEYFNDGRYGALKYNNPRRYAPGLYNFNGFEIKFSSGEGRYEANVPDRAVTILCLPDILGFTAWAGLRPLTNLEYEKACRGPRAVARDEDAWTPDACAPAAGIPAFVGTQIRKDVLPERRPFWPRPSYWGIQDLSMSGCVQEWPLAVNNHPVQMGKGATQGKGIGTGYKGTHGTGSPQAPDDWPWSAWGEWYERSYGQWAYQGQGFVGNWLMASDFENQRGQWDNFNCSRTGRYGVRAARTAPVKAKYSPLALDPLPDMRGQNIDVGIFELTGRYNNTNDKPLKIELKTTLPDACFPGGAASRVFTAAPKAVTPFRILTAVTIQSAASAVRRTLWLPVQIRDSRGRVLAKRDVQLLIDKPESRLGPWAPKPSIDSLVGGELIVRIKNATARLQALTLNLPPPPGVKMSESSRSVSIAAGELAEVSYRFPRQGFPKEGACEMPYRVAISKGAPLDGVTVVVLQARSRWWFFRQDKVNVRLDDVAGTQMGGDDNEITELMTEMAYEYGSVLKANAPRKGWKSVIYDAAPLQVHAGTHTLNPAGVEYRGILIGMVPRGGKVVAATRFEALRDQDVTIMVAHNANMLHLFCQFANRVWINDALVYQSPIGQIPDPKDERNKPKTCRIRKGGNTMVVEVKQDDWPQCDAGTLIIQLLDAKDGKPAEGLIFDVDKK